MHSPSVYQDHAANIRRSSPYCYPAARSPDRDVAPSSKILHSILHNFAQSTNYMTTHGARFGRESRERVTSVDDGGDRERAVRSDQDELLAAYRQPGLLYVQRVPTTYERNSPLSRYYPGPSATVTSPPHHCREYGQGAYQDDYTLARNRSSSLGSTGSSLRESRSPSHDSVASRDSASRYSPVSTSTSPSPSPPAQDSAVPGNGSKLLGILKGGSYTCSYGNGKYARGHTAWSATCSSSSSSSGSGRHQLHPVFEVTSSPALPVPAVKRELPSPSIEDVNSKTASEYEMSWQEEPIDLSCKPKRLRLESVEGPLKSPSVDSGWGSDYLTTSPIDDDHCDSPTEGSPPCRSILESILCGKMSSVRDSSRSGSASPIPKPPGTPSRLEYPCGLIRNEVCASLCKAEQSPPAAGSQSDCPESPCSMTSISTSMPSSPVSSVGSQMSVISAKMPHCPWRQKVTLAKKNLLPVSARVSDWLMKIVSFAKLQPEFSGLPETDKVTLIQHCWTRLMLLYMAETNFQFAVTPVHEDADDGRPPAISGIDPTEPTMDSVELVQNFIRKCQSLQVDAEEFRCLRMYTLFHPGCSGLENVDFVERISSSARQMLQDYVSRTRPGDKLRYSHLLLCLHSLFGVNCGMVQMLFCKHVAKNNDMDQHVKEMMLRCEVFDSSDEDSGNECDPQTIDELEKLGNGR